MVVSGLGFRVDGVRAEGLPLKLPNHYGLNAWFEPYFIVSLAGGGLQAK